MHIVSMGWWALLGAISLGLGGCGSSEIRSRTQTASTDLSSTPMRSIYDFRLQTLDGKAVDFDRYRGQKLLLVNVASKCGYTPQYADLQKLHTQYGDKVTVLGFPANDFGRQEPGTHEEIAEFCEKNYGVTFQLFEKISVKGSDQHELYRWLSTKSENGWNDKAPDWNFCKYLVNERGELVKFYGSAVAPLSEEILKEIR